MDHLTLNRDLRENLGSERWMSHVSTRAFVNATVWFVRQVKMSEHTIGRMIVALGTCRPEFIVTTDATLASFEDIAVGNFMWSDIEYFLLYTMVN